MCLSSGVGTFLFPPALKKWLFANTCGPAGNVDIYLYPPLNSGVWNHIFPPACKNVMFANTCGPSGNVDISLYPPLWLNSGVGNILFPPALQRTEDASFQQDEYRIRFHKGINSGFCIIKESWCVITFACLGVICVIIDAMIIYRGTLRWIEIVCYLFTLSWVRLKCILVGFLWTFLILISCIASIQRMIVEGSRKKIYFLWPLSSRVGGKAFFCGFPYVCRIELGTYIVW